jgi:hypothetical protein
MPPYVPIVAEVSLHVKPAQHHVGHINSRQEKPALDIEKQLNRLCRTFFNDNEQMNCDFENTAASTQKYR